MPPWLLRFLPHIGIAIALGIAIWRIDAAGYNRARKDAERRELTQAILIAKAERRLSQQISEGLATLDGNAAARLSEINVTERTIVQPTIVKEIQREARLSNPAAGLTPGLLNAVNQARNASADRPAPSGVSK
jgi:hypothetical protein